MVVNCFGAAVGLGPAASFFPNIAMTGSGCSENKTKKTDHELCSPFTFASGTRRRVGGAHERQRAGSDGRLGARRKRGSLPVRSRAPPGRCGARAAMAQAGLRVAGAAPRRRGGGQRERAGVRRGADDRRAAGGHLRALARVRPAVERRGLLRRHEPQPARQGHYGPAGRRFCADGRARDAGPRKQPGADAAVQIRFRTSLPHSCFEKARTATIVSSSLLPAPLTRSLLPRALLPARSWAS